MIATRPLARADEKLTAFGCHTRANSDIDMGSQLLLKVL
jgi:hypothetical protein